MKKLSFSEKILTKNNFFWFIFFIALIKSSLFSHLGFGLLDEGESLHNATRIIGGDLPYKDFFAIFPPVDNYFFSIIFKFFGKSVLAPRLVMSLIFSFAPAFMYLIISKYSNKIISFIPPLLLIFLDLNVERLYFYTPILMSIYLLSTNIFISGLLLGITSLIRIDLPGTFLIGFVVTILFQNFKKSNKAYLIKKLFLLSVGYLIPIALLVFWMLKNNILNLFFKSAFVDSVLITKLHDLPTPGLFDIFPKSISLQSFSNSYQSFYFYFVIFVYIFFLSLILTTWKEIKNKDYWVFGVFVSGILSIPYVLGRTDLGHIVKGTMPVLIIAPFLLQFQNRFKLFLTIFLSFAALLIFVVNLVQSIWWIGFNDTNVTINNYNLRVNSKPQVNSTVASAETLVVASRYLNETDQNEKVLALPYHAGLYFLSDRNPPSKFNNLLAGFVNGEENQRNFIQSIKDNNVQKILYSRDSGPKMTKNRLFEYNSLIDQYIMNNYEVVYKTSEGWLLMKKK